RRRINNLPPDTRPAVEEIADYARFLASYLTTTYEVAAAPKPQRVSDGCDCSWCVYFIPGNHLAVRKVTDHAKEQAKELKLRYLQSIQPEDDGRAARALPLILQNRS